MHFVDGYYYHLIEAPDLSLGCLQTPGQQNWVLGLLRSSSLATPTGGWEQISADGKNPSACRPGVHFAYLTD